MLLRLTTPFIMVSTIFLAHMSMTAVMLTTSSQDKSISTEPWGYTEVYSNSTEIANIEGRQAAEIAEVAIQAITGLITGIQYGINRDKERVLRSQFTQNLVSQMHQKHPKFNWIICHTKHTYKFDGKRGVYWDHKYQEFDIKIGGTIG